MSWWIMYLRYVAGLWRISISKQITVRYGHLEGVLDPQGIRFSIMYLMLMNQDWRPADYHFVALEQAMKRIRKMMALKSMPPSSKHR